jgi:hypothetical protein
VDLNFAETVVGAREDGLIDDDPYQVKEAALLLGRAHDGASVDSIIAAYDKGGFAAFKKRPQVNEARGGFGSYRDKVQGITDALWMIGDPRGTAAAIGMLEQTLKEGEARGLDRKFMDHEAYVLRQLQTEAAYRDDWYADMRNEAEQPTKGGGCFIATAALGSPDAFEISTLYRWRDDVLAHTAAGRAFVKLYYRLSPPVARMIERSPRSQDVVANLLIRPWCRAIDALWPEHENSDNE